MNRSADQGRSPRFRLEGAQQAKAAPLSRQLRAAVCVLVLVVLSGATLSQGVAEVASLPGGFPDVGPDHWAYSEINACLAAGIVAGYEDGYYHPERQVTRDQMAVYVARAFALPM